MAHTGRRLVAQPDRLAGGAAGPQAPRGLHRVAPHGREHPVQRGLRPPRHSLGHQQGRDRKRDRSPSRRHLQHVAEQGRQPPGHHLQGQEAAGLRASLWYRCLGTCTLSFFPFFFLLAWYNRAFHSTARLSCCAVMVPCVAVDTFEWNCCRTVLYVCLYVCMHRYGWALCS